MILTHYVHFTMLLNLLAVFTKYEYYGTFRVPFGNVSQPLYVAYDEVA